MILQYIAKKDSFQICSTNKQKQEESIPGHINHSLKRVGCESNKLSALKKVADKTLKFNFLSCMVMEKKLLYKIYVTGKVQGVGFRWSAANEAKYRGINGLVKNLSDGTVYIEAEGYEDQLDAYVKWCRKGSGFSFVESVEVDSFPPVNYTDFRIEH